MRSLILGAAAGAALLSLSCGGVVGPVPGGGAAVKARRARPNGLARTPAVARSHRA